MAIEIAFETSVDVADGGKSLKSLKQEFRDTQKELDGVDVGTKKYIDTLKKLGKIKDEIGDLKNNINAFNPDQKLKALSGALGGVASGFSAVTSATALFGGENKELEKTLLKVQAAMAFSQAINQLGEVGDAFKTLGLVIKAAFESNPVGLLIAGIIALGAAIAGLIGSQKSQAEKDMEIIELERKHLKVIDDMVDALEKKNAILNKSYNFELELLKAKGATQEEIDKKEDEIYEKRRAQLMYIQKLRGRLSAEESAELLELTNNKQLSDAKQFKAEKDWREKNSKDKKESYQKDATDKEIADKAAAAKAIEDKEAGEAAWKQMEEQINQDTLDRLKDRIKKSNDLEINSLKVVEDATADSESKKIALASDRKEEALRLTYEQSEKTLKDFDNLNAGLLAIDKETNKQVIDNNKKTNDTTAANDKAALAAKKKARDDDFNNALKVTQSLQNISDIYFTIHNANLKKGSKEQKKAAEDQFKINKALNLASATITGVKTVIDAYEAGASIGGPAALATGAAYAVAAGIAVAAQLVKIASTNFDSGSSSGVDTSSFASTPNVSNVSAPTINNPNSGQTSLNPDGTINNGQPTTQPNTPTVRAYVVETEITSVQARIGRISSHATL